MICLTWNAADYLQLLSGNLAFSQARQQITNLSEVFDILSLQIAQQPLANHNLKDLTQQVLLGSKIHYLRPGKTSLRELESDRIWFVSSSCNLSNFTPG
ncbi:MAG: cyclic nucleotide-binding domain-containing protein, partial [Dolichospermum sp.]